ncbi:hypothetical protein ACFL5Q_08070 [Planctomycetota bacterium]
MSGSKGSRFGKCAVLFLSMSVVLCGLTQEGTAQSNSGQGKPATVRITRISASRGVIAGEVADLPGPANEYFVTVYVKTNIWYIHPFVSVDDYAASIDGKGHWKIEHVLRGSEEQLGAVVLPRSGDQPPLRSASLGSVPAAAKAAIPYNSEWGEKEGAVTLPKGASVRITSISASRGLIKGEVANLPGPTKEYVVAVYAKTDDWYVHPFTGRTAPIAQNGQWQIQHVARGDEKKLGAVVLSRSPEPPAREVRHFDGLNVIAKCHMPYQPEWPKPKESSHARKEAPDRQGLLAREQEPAQVAGAKGPSIRITTISARQGVIEGEVANLPGSAKDYVVVVYVKTDDWYIHPFTGSTTPVGENGQWRVTHVPRNGEHQLGAVVLRRSADPPTPRLGSLDALPAVVKTVIPYQREVKPQPARQADEGSDQMRQRARQEAGVQVRGAKSPSVRITRISASGGVIKGEVANLPKAAGEYVVAVYVKTDDWYAHPFIGSQAPVDQDGRWEIEHVLRGGEQQLGAVVLPRSTDPLAPRLGSLDALAAAAKGTIRYQSEYEAERTPPDTGPALNRVKDQQ